jgi:hypothetical protein
MKFVTYVAVAASLFAIAAAVQQTTYTDTACKTMTAATTAAPNPFSTNLGACTAYMGGSVKMISCASGGAFVGASYSDAACATLDGAITGTADKCTPAGSGSYLVTCSSTSSVTMAFLAVAAAVLALSF